jgi:hypothetical protein
MPLKKVTVERIENRREDTRTVECVSELQRIMGDFFTSISGHGVVDTPLENFRNSMNLFAETCTNMRLDIIKNIHLHYKMEWTSGVFYDWNRGLVKEDISSELKAIKLLNESSKFIGYYIPSLNILLGTDWSHSESTIRTFKEFKNELIEKLELKPINKDTINKKAKPKPKKINVTVGCDPEFEILNNRKVILNASNISFISDGNTDNKIGIDGSGDQVEFRPDYGTPAKVAAEMEILFKTFVNKSKNKMQLTISGHRYPLGGHIHIGVGKRINPPRGLVEMLDDFIGKKTLCLSGSARGGYGGTGAYEGKPWGYEYRTPPAAIFYTKKLATIFLKLARNINRYYFSSTLNEIEYNDPVTFDDYNRIGKVTLGEYKYMFATINLLKEYIDKGNHIVADWSGNVLKEKEVNYNLKLDIRDDWNEDIKEEFEEYLYETLGTLKLKIVVRGLRGSRGLVSNIPGIKWWDNQDLVETEFPIVQEDGSLLIALPKKVRLYRDYFNDYKVGICSSISFFVNDFKEGKYIPKTEKKEVI